MLSKTIGRTVRCIGCAGQLAQPPPSQRLHEQRRCGSGSRVQIGPDIGPLRPLKEGALTLRNGAAGAFDGLRPLELAATGRDALRASGRGPFDTRLILGRNDGGTRAIKLTY
jgi:hypothetical protein